MIALSFPAALLLLLLLPPLILLSRRRAVPRRVEITAYFLLEEVLRLRNRRVPRIFRLSRNQRTVLLVLTIASLAVAAAGPSWERRTGAARRVLLVVDNPATAARPFAGGTFMDAVRRRVAADARAASSRETVTLLVTAPAPALSTHPGARGLADAVDAVAPAAVFPAVETAAADVLSIARFYDRAVILSPRAASWRRAVAASPGAPVIPPDRETAGGNAGIVELRLRPSRSAEGAYDLWAVAAAAGAPLPATVRVEQGSSLLASGRPSADGGILLAGLRPAPGPLAVSIPGGDAFPFDDRITVAVPADDPVRASLAGTGADIVAAAVKAATGRAPVARARAEVDVFLGDPPEALDKPSLVIAPSTELPGLEFRELAAVVSDVAWHPVHPITAGLTGRSFRPDRALAFDIAGGFTSVAAAGGVPLVLAGAVDGRRTVVWTFSPLDGGVLFAPEFVILLQESLRWLARPAESEPSPAPSRETTLEGGAVSLPDLGQPLFPGERTEIASTPLTSWFLALFLVAGLFLAVSDAFTAGEVRDR